MSEHTRNKFSALVSIHDLMPETMECVERLLRWLDHLKVPPVTLLIVPGKPWSKAQIARLRTLSWAGHELAAHGWHHHTTPRKAFHRLHATLLSRNVAEHLDLDSSEIKSLMQRSHDWFSENNLPSPKLYVPPAWALGPIRQEDLETTPYSLIETTRGIRLLKESPNGYIKIKLPLAGFEADTRLRASFLKQWNRQQESTARRMGLPLRISIHPDDLDLRVAEQMKVMLKDCDDFKHYTSLSVVQ